MNHTDEYETGDFKTLNPSRFVTIVQDPTEMLYPWRHQPSILVSVGVHCTVFLVGVLGHFIMLTYLFKTNIRKHNFTTGIFLASLSAAELLLLFVYIPLEIWKSLFPQVAKGGTICKVTEYIKMLTAAASVINLAAVSFERYIVVVYPMKSKLVCTKNKCIASVISVWILSCILSLPVLLTNDVYSLVYSNRENTTNVEVYICTDDKDSESAPWIGRSVSLYQLCVLLVIPLILSTCCYQAVIRVLWHSVRNVDAMSNCTSLRVSHQPRCYSFRHRGTRSSVTRGGGDQAAESRVNSVRECKKENGLLMQETRFTSRVRGGSADLPCGQGATADDIKSADFKDKKKKTVSVGQLCQCNQGWIAAQKINAGRKNTIKMLILILVMYFLCWGLWLTAKLIMWWAGNTYIPYSPSYFRFSVIAKHLPAIHATINPVIYSVMSGNFRNHICFCK